MNKAKINKLRMKFHSLDREYRIDLSSKCLLANGYTVYYPREGADCRLPEIAVDPKAIC